MKIYKYPLQVTDAQIIVMPTGAFILCVQVQHEQPCIWAIVDPDAAKERRHIYTIGTGHEMDKTGLTYLGTYQLQDGALVFHVFEGTV